MSIINIPKELYILVGKHLDSVSKVCLRLTAKRFSNIRIGGKIDQHLAGSSITISQLSLIAELTDPMRIMTALIYGDNQLSLDFYLMNMSNIDHLGLTNLDKPVPLVILPYLYANTGVDFDHRSYDIKYMATLSTGYDVAKYKFIYNTYCQYITASHISDIRIRASLINKEYNYKLLRQMGANLCIRPDTKHEYLYQLRQLEEHIDLIEYYTELIMIRCPTGICIREKVSSGLRILKNAVGGKLLVLDDGYGLNLCPKPINVKKWVEAMVLIYNIPPELTHKLTIIYTSKQTQLFIDNRNKYMPIYIGIWLYNPYNDDILDKCIQLTSNRLPSAMIINQIIDYVPAVHIKKVSQCLEKRRPELIPELHRRMIDRYELIDPYY